VFRRCRIRGSQYDKAKEADEAESEQPASTPAPGKPLSAHMVRFLSIVEHELDAEDPEAADQEKTQEDKPHKLPATAIVALEVKTKSDSADDDDGDDDANKGKDAAEGDNDDESGSRLVVIDKTRLVPEVDIDTFIGY